MMPAATRSPDFRDLAQRLAEELNRQLDFEFDPETDTTACDLLREAKAAGLRISGRHTGER